MRLAPVMFCSFVLLPAAARAGNFVDGELVIDGQRVGVRWNDGDSFAFTDGPYRKKRARLMDVNALENYAADRADRRGEALDLHDHRPA